MGRTFIALLVAVVAVAAVVVCLRNMPVEEPVVVPAVEAVPVEEPCDFGDPEDCLAPAPVEVPVVE